MEVLMATFSRRGFMKITGAGVAAMSLGQLGLDLKSAHAYATTLKIEGAKEVLSTCPFCSCGCEIIMHTKNGKIISSEGNADYPVSEGALCAKGAAFYSMHVSDHRLLKPKYRAPGSGKWEEKDWNWMLDRIARRIKDTRDKDFKVKNDKGQTVNRWESYFQLGTSQMDNEECALTHQLCRALGGVNIDHQARV
ncbi:MAG: twin-arginine translocation signal domain-containing protein [Deltaproteobacteria bacterium]|nr:twin-arginine translocation signal domain-containing protein [Deltaproteobacteria bacterium]